MLFAFVHCISAAIIIIIIFIYCISKAYSKYEHIYVI